MDAIYCPKCKHEHVPEPPHESNTEEWECEECGFAFNVYIEYEPDYSTKCVEHEFGEFGEYERHPEARFCIHCQKCDLRSPTFLDSIGMFKQDKGAG